MQARVVIRENVDRPYVAFTDRDEAGRVLAEAVVTEPNAAAVVLALPRGGIPVAVPVSRALHCRLHPMPVRKLPLPDSPEMGFGAVTLDGTVTLNHAVMREHGVGMGQAAVISEKVQEEVRRRAREYPGAEELPVLRGRKVYLVDDGLATGYTMVAACEMVRHHEPAEVTVAVPVAPQRSIELLSHHCDRLICLIAQGDAGFAVAAYYRWFPDLSDDEVREALAQATYAGVR